MKSFAALFLAALVLQLAPSLTLGQTPDAARFRELREKARSGKITPEEKAELDAVMQARTAGRPTTPPAKPTEPAKPPGTPMPTKPEGGKPPAVPQSREEMRKQRMDQYAERQEFVFERSLQQKKMALDAAAGRKASGAAHEYFVNNETGTDSASGLSAEQAVRTLAKGVSLLKPGDTLHLAVTSQPYRETLHLGDDFGGVEGKSITIAGHGATLTGSDPLRTEGWTEAGTPGLYKSAKFLSELEEFTDEAKLMRVYFIFDGEVQTMGRSSKGSHARLKAPSDLRAGEWTYVEAEKTFYLKVKGNLADAKIEAPYRRNGVAVRAPKVALTHVVIQDLIVCHVLNDGWNLHGTTQNLLLKNIAAYECGDDGISPHETCEVMIDGYWGVGNSTGMANGNLSVTKARNVHLEGNTAHQFMTGHAPTTELQNARIIAQAGTQPVNVTNAQDTRWTLDNVQIVSPPGQKVLNVAHSQIDARRITVIGPSWENAGSIRVSDSAIAGGSVVNLPDGTWSGERNVYAIAFGPEARNTGCEMQRFEPEVLQKSGQPFAHAGADPSEFNIPPHPVPHPAAGKFTALSSLGVK